MNNLLIRFITPSFLLQVLGEHRERALGGAVQTGGDGTCAGRQGRVCGLNRDAVCVCVCVCGEQASEAESE